MLWTVAHQALLSMGFSRQEYWCGLPCPPPGDLPDPGIELKSLASPALTGGFFTTSATWEGFLPICSCNWGVRFRISGLGFPFSLNLGCQCFLNPFFNYPHTPHLINSQVLLWLFKAMDSLQSYAVWLLGSPPFYSTLHVVTRVIVLKLSPISHTSTSSSHLQYISSCTLYSDMLSLSFIQQNACWALTL